MTQEEKNKILADKNSASNATAESAQKTALGGVDQATLDKTNSTFTASDSQTQAQGKATNQLTNYENIANKDSIVSDKTWNTINQSFKTPSAVTEADAYLKGQLSKIQSGKTSYSDQITNLMSQISNRDKFSYDVDNDPLFQQALASAMNSGKSAMQDTIGQASALTGGYGSSYATSAGNQAYNAFIEDAYNNLPEYYQMALDAYNAEGEELYRQLDMYNTADATEYGRTLDAYDATGTYRDRLYNEAYQQFRDSKSDAFASANLQISEHGQLSSDAYNLYSAYANEADKMYEREFQKWDAEVSNAMQYAQMLNSDYWNQQDYQQADEHFYEGLVHDTSEREASQIWQSEESEKDRAHDTAENQAQRDWQTGENDKDRAHDTAENQAQRDWQTGENQKNRDHDTAEREASQIWQSSENAKDRATKTYSSGGSDSSSGNGITLSNTEYNAAVKAYNAAGGGEAGAEAAAATLAAYGIDITANPEDFNTIVGALEANADAPITPDPAKTGTTKNFNVKSNSSFTMITSSGTKTMINNGEVSGTEIKNALKKYNVDEGKVFTHNGKMYVKSGEKSYYVSTK